MKNEFLVQMEGFSTGNDFVIVVGATNRPQELDDAARRRFPKRAYVSLPDDAARAMLLRNELRKEKNHAIGEREIEAIVRLSEGFSCADLANVCAQAAQQRAREWSIAYYAAGCVATPLPPVQLKDFEYALKEQGKSVKEDSLSLYEQWTRDFGTTVDAKGEQLFSTWMASVRKARAAEAAARAGAGAGGGAASGGS